LNWVNSPYQLKSRPKESRADFETEHGLTYSIILVPATNYFDGYPDWNKDVYSIIFECNGKPVADDRVMPTITLMLYCLFVVHNNICLFWICETTNNKHHARYRYFNKIYRQTLQAMQDEVPKTLERHEFIKEDGQIFDDDMVNYASIVLSGKHPHKDQILNAFNAGIASLSKRT
jgi:hypothetical protein